LGIRKVKILDLNTFQELHHTKGLCYVALKDYNAAAEAFQTANSINVHEAT